MLLFMKNQILFSLMVSSNKIIMVGSLCDLNKIHTTRSVNISSYYINHKTIKNHETKMNMGMVLLS